MDETTPQNKIAPALPRLCAPPATPVEFAYKESPDDFVVEEIPLYEPSGEGTHTWLWIEKRGLTTHAAARVLGHKLGKNPFSAGIAGLKDAQAVTRQWISFEHVAHRIENAAALSDEKLRVLTVTRHGNKLRMGHLLGNRFLIRLKPAAAVPVQELHARAKFVLSELSRGGIPNYFGEQRFGNAGDNAALGKLLVRGETAAFNDAMNAAGQSRQIRDRKIRNLLVNAYQSELFNRVLAARMPEIGTLQTGDLAWLHRNGAIFKISSPEEASKEQPRADAQVISPSGPIFGPKMISPVGSPGETEARILQDENVALADFGRPEAERQPGARRPLRVFFLEDARAEIEAESVMLRFALPSGSYATVVLEEIRGQLEIQSSMSYTATDDASRP